MCAQKKSPSSSKPGRNALCPCGSGRAYKRCCGAPQAAPVESAPPARGSRRQLLWWGALAVFVLAGILVFLLPTGAPEPAEPPPSPARPPMGGGVTWGSADRPAATPQPWEYDAANNRHWHAGHGHWHPGPPPPEAVGGATPQPWEYDSENDRHWHAGHAHWHPGPPPPPEQR